MMERLTQRSKYGKVQCRDIPQAHIQSIMDKLAMYEEMHEIYIKYTGDNVYYIGQGECWECIFCNVDFAEDGGISFMIIDSEGEGINCNYSEWGKTVFPTQEKAESVLINFMILNGILKK